MLLQLAPGAQSSRAAVFYQEPHCPQETFDNLWRNCGMLQHGVGGWCGEGGHCQQLEVNYYKKIREPNETCIFLFLANLPLFHLSQMCNSLGSWMTLNK